MLNVICFSKDRPLQLQGCIASWQALVEDPQLLRFQVLGYLQPPYDSAYTEVAREFSNVTFRQEARFAADIADMLGGAEYTCFCCDDVLVVRGIHLESALGFLDRTKCIGLSLRLGTSVTKGFFQSAMRQPTFHEAEGDDHFVTWDMNGADQDWCYPWDVLGTIYRTEFVRDMWPTVATARNPSEFESFGATAWPQVTSQRTYGSWRLPRTVVPTVNVVQNVFPNGFVGASALSAEFLLDCWNAGMRLDIERYREQTYDNWRIGDFYLKRAA